MLLCSALYRLTAETATLLYNQLFTTRGRYNCTRQTGNEQAEDCSNDVTQMSRVQISRLKMRVQIRASYFPSPLALPLPLSSPGHNQRVFSSGEYV
ncbi:hypothetical protein FQN60_002981, partial [Etheostoma spectabile]